HEVLSLKPSFSSPDDSLYSEVWEYKRLKIREETGAIGLTGSYNRDPKYFPKQDEFEPERFMPCSEDRIDPMTSRTFGHGPRITLG
ncbi:unnamed protein product, partial [Allacma fusca]